jgi:hypothetical protein
MNNNDNLIKAKQAKDDEFYTLLTDIEKELRHYKDMFVGKTIYCNCDNPTKSNFVKWFYMNFNILHLKRIIVTAYNSDTCNGGGYYWDSDFATVDPKSIDISKEIEKDVRKLNGNGDFRSEECIELLKQADIVVTNPPFSLFREYVKVLMDNNKDFVILGNMNAITYKEVFPCIKNNKIGLGFTNGGKSFITPDGVEQKFGNIFWYTTLPIAKYKEELILYKHYTPEEFPKYDNYDAINVDKTCDIPADYDGAMGVPISFMKKYNPNQFEIIGNEYSLNIDRGRGYVAGKRMYSRIFIKKIE